MADNDTPTPMSDADVTPPPSTTEFQPAAPLKDAGVDFEPEQDASTGDSGASEDKAAGKAGVAQSVRDNASGLGQQATDKVRLFAESGKERAGGALDQIAQMLTDAAGQVDDKVGAQYGDYARTAASSVQGFAQSVRDKDVDEFADDVRGYVRQSPAAALGIAAAFGFVVARVVHAGLDQRR